MNSLLKPEFNDVSVQSMSLDYVNINGKLENV